MVVSGDGDHRGVVGRELELGQIGVPAALAAFGFDAGAKAAVGGHAAADRNLPDPRQLRGLDELVQQDVDQGLLERSAEVLLVLLQELRVLRHLVPDEIQERSLDAAEAVVQAFDVRLGELEAGRVPLLRKPVDDGAAGIAQAQHLGAFVEGLPHRVIDGLAEALEMQRVVHPDDLRVAAAHQQAEIREGRLPDGLVRLADEIGQQMALQMVHHHDRDVQRQAHGLGEGGAHQERTEQARAAGEGDRRQVGRLHARPGEGFADHRDDVEFVGPGRQLRNHPAEGAVDVLAGNHVGQQPTVADDGRGGVVAGGFYAENDVCHLSVSCRLQS